METKNDNTNRSAKRWSNFPKDYPVIWNIILIILSAFVLIWIMLALLDVWTLHGDEDVVPDVKGLNYNQAETVLKKSGMTAEITDSIFESAIAPGTVVEQNP